jgi:hypothetical protein
MPAILTHDFFGRDVYKDVSAALGFMTPAQRDAFLLGNQGPDPLFYLAANPRVSAGNRVGELMHRDAPTRLFASLKQALAALGGEDRSVGEAYAAGFLCHYLLDRTAHPFVFATEFALCDAGVPGLNRSDGGLVHVEIERDLDEAILYTKLAETIDTYRPYREVLQASDATLAAIDKLYRRAIADAYGRSLADDCYTRAVKTFRLVQHLFYSPTRGKAHVLAPLELRFSPKRYSLYRAMAHHSRTESTSAFDNRNHRSWTNPFDDTESRESFWDLYQTAQTLVDSGLTEFFAANFDEVAAEHFTRNLNFSGAPAS